MEIKITILETLDQYKNVLASNLGCKILLIRKLIDSKTLMPKAIFCIYSEKDVNFREYYEISMEIIGNQNNDFPYTINEHDVIVKKEA